MDKPVLVCLALALATPAGATQTPPRGDAEPQVVKVFDNRIEATTDLPTYALQTLRKRMQAGERLTFEEMRRLADAGDGLAAFRYGQRLMALDDPDVLPAAALYFASAAYTGRDYAVRPLVELLERGDLELSDARLEHLENALRAFAIQGNSHATSALARFYESGEPFGLHPDRAQSLLIEQAEAGDLDAAMTVATRAMSGEVDLPPERVRALLGQVAENAESLGRKTMAENLLRRMELAEADTTAAEPTPAPANATEPED